MQRCCSAWGCVSDFDAAVEMEFAWPAVVEQAKGDIAVLLYLDEAHPAADGVDGASRNKKDVSRLNFMPYEKVDDTTVERCITHLCSADRFAKACGNLCPGLSVGDYPTLAFACSTQAHCSSLFVIGMRLNRKPFTGEDVFNKQFVEIA